MIIIIILNFIYKDTQDIQKLQKTFHEMMNINKHIQVKSFIETKLTLMKLIYLRIVSIQSAGIYIFNIFMHSKFYDIRYYLLNVMHPIFFIIFLF